MSNQHLPIRTPLSQRLVDFKHRTLPLLIWSLSGIVVVTLLLLRVQRLEYIGLAQSMQYEVSSSTPGVVQNVIVDLYDEVGAGDVVAVLDDAQVRASIQTAQARITQLRAELEATRVEVMSDAGQSLADWTKDLRRFQIDEEQRRLDALALGIKVKDDEIELERLALELRRSAPLLPAGLISEIELQSIQLEYDQIASRIRDNRGLLDETTAELSNASERRVEFEAELPRFPGQDTALGPLREAITVENHVLDEIELLRASLVLRSPVDGQVSQIICRRGQSVVAGEPILTIAENSVEEIVAYLRETDGRQIETNSPVLISSRGPRGKIAESVVVRGGPTVELLPQRLWRNPRLPEYGRAVVIAAAPGLNLRPGEIVSIKFNPTP